MDNDRKRINIMTSCDDNLTKYIFVQLRTIAIHLKDKDVHFYLFYNRIPEENLEKLEIYCECLGNITFHRVFIEDVNPYIELADQGHSVREGTKRYTWPCEAYFSLESYKYLPLEIDRILYIDAGDVLFTGGIDEFYFDDFDDKLIIATLIIAKGNGDCYESSDLTNDDYLQKIAYGIFNSGSYVMNIEKFRMNEFTIEKIIRIAQKYTWNIEGKLNYLGDQGLLSILFIDQIKYFKYNELRDKLYRPYNFELWLYRNEFKDTDIFYDPKIIHYTNTTPKPWNLINLLIRAGALVVGEKKTVVEILQLAIKTKYDLVNKEHLLKGMFIIEFKMIPFYEYWLEMNNLVQMELEEIFEKTLNDNH